MFSNSVRYFSKYVLWLLSFGNLVVFFSGLFIYDPPPTKFLIKIKNGSRGQMKSGTSDPAASFQKKEEV